MAVEEKRFCGYRKKGGLYLCGEGLEIGCTQLPYLLDICPACGAGIKQSRGFTWVIPKMVFPKAQDCVSLDCAGFGVCPAVQICPFENDNKVGILWVGEKFYTPGEFTEEARKMGISKRIGAVPLYLKLGETWVFLAHPKACSIVVPGQGVSSMPGIFYIFKPTRIEKIVGESEYKNQEEMEKLRKQNITPVPVPDDDLDHQGSVYARTKEV